MTRATELPLQIYVVSRRSPFIDIVIVYNQDDFVADLLDNRDGFSFRDFGFILGLHFCFDGDQLHRLGSRNWRSEVLNFVADLSLIDRWP